jgi:hypothetical protein
VFFFNISKLYLLVFGLAAMLFGPILIISGKTKLRSFTGIANTIWGIIFGLWLITGFYSAGINRPYRGMMGDNKNVVGLLDKGRIIEAKVLAHWYDEERPSRWMILYGFQAVNPTNSKTETFYGSARGLGCYFSGLAKGDHVFVIYDPTKPNVNSEMYEFLNKSSYRDAFRAAGKLDLLTKYADNYKVEENPPTQW